MMTMRRTRKMTRKRRAGDMLMMMTKVIMSVTRRRRAGDMLVMMMIVRMTKVSMTRRMRRAGTPSFKFFWQTDGCARAD